MISKKWWIPFATSGAMAAALLVAPGVTLAHSLPSATSQHQGSRGSEINTPVVSLVGQVKTTSQGVSLVTSSGTTYSLQFGPPWFSANAFSTVSGTTATVQGHLSQHKLHVTQVNGKNLRGKGKPPWAGMHGGGHGHG